MSERLPIKLQRTYDAIIWYCDREEVGEFVAEDVAAPKGHLRALRNRGKVRRDRKMKGRGSGAPIIWKLVRNIPSQRL